MTVGKPRMTVMKNINQGFIRDQSGVTAMEYGLIASLIAVAIIAAVTLTGTDLTEMFNNIAADL